MPRSRPASNPISFHKHTKQYYVTRNGKRIYLGSDKKEALKKYHRMGLGVETRNTENRVASEITIKELANRFIATQRANWKNPKVTIKCYQAWLGRFLRDYPELKACKFSIEMFSEWKLSLKERGYSAESINHYLSAVRSIFNFAEDMDLISKAPKLNRVKNEPTPRVGSKKKPLYSREQIKLLLENSCIQMKAMILLALNCGFGPKDMHDLKWEDIDGKRITLPRSKTGVSQTYLLWEETKQVLDALRLERRKLIERLAKRERIRSDNGQVFVTKFWNPWNKDAISNKFQKLCKRSKVPCYGIYRLRHCASTAMSMVANPHLQMKFLRHSNIQQQVTYTHLPDKALDTAIEAVKEQLLGD
jgi:integrase